MNYYEKYKVNVPEGIIGDWRIEKFIVKDHDVGRIRYQMEGRDCLPGTYTRLMHKSAFDPMMSDTPAEIEDCIGFINKAKGNVLVNGLGLGVVVKAIFEKSEVAHVDVVEINKDIISLVWPSYKDSSKVTIYNDDAFTIQWEKGKKWDYVWHDIWPSICTDNLSEITKLKRKYAHRTKYQEAWVEDLLRYYRRTGR